MDRNAVGLAALLIGTAAAGCGGGGQKYPHQTVSFDASNARDGGKDASSEETMAPPPVTGVNSRRLIPGAAHLIGSGPNSCTNQVPAPGDRWCAFALPSSFLGLSDLWVIDVTKAAEGTEIKCDGSDGNCLRLTSSLYSDSMNQLRIHGFDGDTLIYYAEPGPTATQTAFTGFVWAWRPGWAGARELTDNSGVICTGHSKTDVAYCFQKRDQSVTGQVSYDLVAGKLPVAGGMPLTKIESVLVLTDQDMQGVRKFAVDFSPDGAYLAWSARPTATGVETLKVQKVGDATSRQTVMADVTRWRIAADGSRWYWLKTFNYDVSGAASGTLQTAPFPGGAPATTLAMNVGDYDLSGANGVIFRDGLVAGKGGLKLMADTATPATVKTLDTGVLGVFDVSKDGARVLYTKSGVADPLLGNLFDMYSVGVDSGTPCTIARTPSAPSLATLLASGRGAVWAQFDNTTGAALGMFTNIVTCTSGQFATDIFRWSAVGDQGFMYADDTSTDMDPSVTVRYIVVPATGIIPIGTSVQTRANPIYAPLTPSLPAVLYTVNLGSTVDDGLYINAKLPFAGEIAPTNDGGTPVDGPPAVATDAPPGPVEAPPGHRAGNGAWGRPWGFTSATSACRLEKPTRDRVAPRVLRGPLSPTSPVAMDPAGDLGTFSTLIFHSAFDERHGASADLVDGHGPTASFPSRQGVVVDAYIAATLPPGTGAD